MTPPKRLSDKGLPLQLPQNLDPPSAGSNSEIVFGADSVVRPDGFVAIDPPNKIKIPVARRPPGFFGVRVPLVESQAWYLPSDRSVWITLDILNEFSRLYEQQNPSVRDSRVLARIEAFRRRIESESTDYIEIGTAEHHEVLRHSLQSILRYFHHSLNSDAGDRKVLAHIMKALQQAPWTVRQRSVEVRSDQVEIANESKPVILKIKTQVKGSREHIRLEKEEIALLTQTAQWLKRLVSASDTILFHRYVSSEELELFLSQIDNIGNIRVEIQFFRIARNILVFYNEISSEGTGSGAEMSDHQVRRLHLMSKLEGILKRLSSPRRKDLPSTAGKPQKNKAAKGPVEVSSPAEGSRSLKYAIYAARDLYLRDRTPEAFKNFYDALEAAKPQQAHALLSDRSRLQELQEILGEPDKPFDKIQAGVLQAAYIQHRGIISSKNKAPGNSVPSRAKKTKSIKPRRAAKIRPTE